MSAMRTTQRKDTEPLTRRVVRRRETPERLGPDGGGGMSDYDLLAACLFGGIAVGGFLLGLLLVVAAVS